MVFDSNFESGNLEIVVKRKYLDYELYMRPDTNTASYYQWFYFKTKVAKGRKTVNFTFRNFIKQSMLYSSGLKPYYRSSLAAKLNYQQIKGTVSYF